MKEKDLLDKWLNDELTPEEFEVIRTIPEFSSYQKIDDHIKHIDLPRKMDEATLNALKVRLSDKTLTYKPRVISISVLSKIAALLILILASYYFISNSSTTITTTLAQTETYILPDNSEVILNENSVLSYKRFKWNSERTLQLSGEGYFDVTPGKTFKVQTSGGVVTVLGTRFSVTVREDQFAVQCFEGMVRIAQDDMILDIPAGKSITMVAGEPLLDEVITTAPGWVYNESAFDDIELSKVIQLLEKAYSVDITTENIDVNLRFTGSFPNDDMYAALKAVTIPFGLNFRIENRNVVTIFAVMSAD